MRLEIDSIVPAPPLAADEKTQTDNADFAEARSSLNQGIKAAQAGNRSQARVSLMRSTELDPRNENAWLWLASISEYPEELLGFLNHVLAINPENERAVEWKAATHALLSKTFVQRGIDAYQDGQQDFAGECFHTALEHNDRNAVAWMWMASISDSNVEKVTLLQRALAIDPTNQSAMTALHEAKDGIVRDRLANARNAAIAGNNAEAIDLLDELLQVEPSSIEAWMMRSHLVDGFDEKIRCFDSILALDPDNVVAKAGRDSLLVIYGTSHRAEERRDHVAETVSNSNVVVGVFGPAEPETSSADRDHVEKPLNPVEYFHPHVEQESAHVDEPVNDHVEEAVESHVEESPVELHRVDDEPVEELHVEQESVEHLHVEEEPAEYVHVQDTPEEYVHLEDEPVAEVHVELEAQPVEDAVETARDLGLLPDMAAEYQAEVEDELVEVVHVEPETHNQGSIEEVVEFRSLAEQPWVPVDRESVDQHAAEPSVEEEDDENNSYEEPPYSSAAEVETSVAADAETRTVVEEREPEAAVAMEAEQVPVVEESEPEASSSSIYDADTEEVADPRAETVTFSYSDLSNDWGAPKVDMGHRSDAEIPMPVDNLPHISHPPSEPAPLNVVENRPTVVPAMHELVTCAFCGKENDSQSISCGRCMAVLTLSDLELLLANTSADKLLVRQAVEEMERYRLARAFTAQELVTLGIGHLNLKNLQLGYNCLSDASRMTPDDVVLGSQVNSLLIRLDEIRQQEEAHLRMPKGKSILVVDDSPTVRKLIAGKLEKCGHEVVCATDGVEAMERLETMVPDLVLLDINMPRMDGYQVCKLIRSNDATKNVTVVMISGKDGFFDKVRGRMAGTTGYITKPFGPETLMKAVEMYLSGEVPEQPDEV